MLITYPALHARLHALPPFTLRHASAQGLIMDLVPNAYAMSNVKYDTANAQIKLGAPQYGSKQTISRTKGSDTSSPVTVRHSIRAAVAPGT